PAIPRHRPRSRRGGSHHPGPRRASVGVRLDPHHGRRRPPQTRGDDDGDHLDPHPTWHGPPRRPYVGRTAERALRGHVVRVGRHRHPDPAPRHPRAPRVRLHRGATRGTRRGGHRDVAAGRRAEELVGLASVVRRGRTRWRGRRRARPRRLARSPSVTPFSPDLPYPSARQPVMARNVVATSQPLAAQAGLRMLERGGNAVDAALAAAIALTVVEPTGNGIGADAFAILWDGETLHGLNASGRSPAGLTADRFAGDRKSTRLNSSHVKNSYAVFCL